MKNNILLHKLKNKKPNKKKQNKQTIHLAMTDVHALALLATSSKLRPNPLTSREQDLYLELLKLFQTLVFKTGSHHSLFTDPIKKPFTAPEFVQYIMRGIPGRIKKKIGDVTKQSTNTKLWGPVMWKFLHWHSGSYTQSQKQLYMRFLQVIASTLPCKECSKHFTSILRRKNAVLAREAATTANEYANYMILLHTMVNHNTNKYTGAIYTRVPSSYKSKHAIRVFLQHRNYYKYSSDRNGRRSSTTGVNLNQQLSKNSADAVKTPAKDCGCAS